MIMFVDDSFNYANKLARSSNPSSFYLLVIRTTVCLLAICSNYEHSAIITSGIFLGIFIVYAFVLHSYHTYYNIPIAAFDMCLFLYQIAISGITLAQGIFVQATNGNIVPSFVFFCCFLFSFKSARILSRKSVMYHIQRRFNVSSSSIGLEKKIKLMYTNFKFQREATLSGNIFPTSEEYLQGSGYLIKAAEDNKFIVTGPASEPNIIFDPFSKQIFDIKVSSNSQKVLSPIYVKHLIKILYQQAIASHPKNANLRVGFANFLLFELQHIYLSIFECIQINRLFASGLHKQYQVSCFYKEIAKLFQDMNKMSEEDAEWSSFDLERLLHIETHFQNLHDSLLRFFQLSKELYDYILSERPNLSILEQKAVIQLENYNQISNSFEKVRTNPRAIKLYIDFLREVMGDNKTARILETKLKHLTDKLIQNKLTKQTLLDPDLAYNEDSTIITIGGTRENIGKIIKANQGVEKLFGHKIEELNLSNVKRLMPWVIGEKHDTFLNNFLETSKMTILNKERRLYGRHKEGHIFSMNLLVKPMFDTNTNLLQFISFIHPLSQDADHLITNSSGLICGISKNMAKTMKLDPLVLETTKVYLPTLAPKSLYLYLEDMDNQRVMRKKNSNKRLQSFKRIETDTKYINRTQEGEFLFHVYVSKNLIESSSSLYDPQRLPESHENLKGNFDGSEVYKIRCSASSFECSDQETRLIFFFVTEVEFLYKKKTKTAIASSVASYKTWNKMFFTGNKQPVANSEENPLNKVASAFKKKFNIKLDADTPATTPKNSKLKANSKKLRNLAIKAVASDLNQQPPDAIQEEANKPESPEKIQKQETEKDQEKEPPKIERKEITPDKTPPRLIITKELDEKQPLLQQASLKMIIEREDSMSHKRNIEKEDSMKLSYKKTLSSGNTLTVENTFKKKTSNELLPQGRIQYALTPILSELEITTQQNIDDDNAKEKSPQVYKPSLLQIDQVSGQNLLSVRGGSLGGSFVGGSIVGTKILSVAQLAQWTNNSNRPPILDNPPINSDSEIEEEEEEEVEKAKDAKIVVSNEHKSDFSSTAGVGNRTASQENTPRANKNDSQNQDSNNTDSNDDFKKSAEKTSTFKKSLSIGSVMKFYTDYSKVFKRLLQKNRQGRGQGQRKGAKFRSIAKAMVEEKLRNFYESEGSVSSGSSKHSNTTKKFLWDAIHHEYIPRAYFYFRAILYLCFVFLMGSTLALALQQSQIFTTLENNYDNGRNYTSYITEIARLGSSVYDLLYLQVNFYSSSSSSELAYLHDLSINKTVDAINNILENYSAVRTGNEDYFVYNDYTNTTQLLTYDNSTGQSLDLPQSIFQLCSSGLNILTGLRNNFTLTTMLPSYAFILSYTTPIVSQMSSKISLNDSLNAIKNNKTISLVVLVTCLIGIAVLWWIAVQSIFKCYVEIQKVLVLFINLPNGDIFELRNIMDQALHTLQNDEFKYRPPPFHLGGKFSVKRFIPLHFPRLKILGTGTVLLILGVLSYTLTIATSHGFDDSLETTLKTASQIDIQLYQKFSWQQSLMDIFFYETEGYNFIFNMKNTSAIDQLYENITDTFVQEVNILSQIESFVAAGSNQTQQVLDAILQNNLCTTPSISINRTSYYPCLSLFDNSLSEGYQSLLSAYADFLKTSLRNILNNSTNVLQADTITHLKQLPDLLDYMSSANTFIQNLMRQQIFAGFERDRWITIAVSILLVVIQLFTLPIVYFLFVKKMRVRFVRARRILSLIPSGVLVRNLKIKKYLQETSASKAS